MKRIQQILSQKKEKYRIKMECFKKTVKSWPIQSYVYPLSILLLKSQVILFGFLSLNYHVASTNSTVGWTVYWNTIDS